MNHNNLYTYMSTDTDLMTLLGTDKIAWSVKPEKIPIGILYKMVSNPMTEGSDNTWQRWRFEIENKDMLICKNIALKLFELLHNIRGNVGGEIINYSFNILDSDPELNGDTLKYKIIQDYRISTH